MIETLRRHKDILMHGEIFHENDLRKSEKDGFDGGLVVGDEYFSKRRTEPRILLEYIGAHSQGRKVVGFKLFSEHLEWQMLPAFLRWSTHVVVLQRTHMLAQYIQGGKRVMLFSPFSRAPVVSRVSRCPNSERCRSSLVGQRAHRSSTSRSVDTFLDLLHRETPKSK